MHIIIVVVNVVSFNLQKCKKAKTMFFVFFLEATDEQYFLFHTVALIKFSLSVWWNCVNMMIMTLIRTFTFWEHLHMTWNIDSCCYKLWGCRKCNYKVQLMSPVQTTAASPSSDVHTVSSPNVFLPFDTCFALSCHILLSAFSCRRSWSFGPTDHWNMSGL